MFDFGERDAVIDAAKQASVISNIAFTAAHQKVIYDVAAAFYAHRRRAGPARHGEPVAEERASGGGRGGRPLRHKEIGTVVEAAQARQATAQASLALVQATGAAQDAYLALISAMGISPLTRIKVADVAWQQIVAGHDAPVESIIATSLSRRPDVLSAYAAEKAEPREYARGAGRIHAEVVSLGQRLL